MPRRGSNPALADRPTSAAHACGRAAAQLASIDTPDSAHKWMALEGDSWSVRGATYLADRRKVASETGSQLLAVELFQSPTAVTNAAGRPGAPTKLLGARCTQRLESVFVVNRMLPRKGGASTHVVLYFGVFAGSAAPGARSSQ